LYRLIQKFSEARGCPKCKASFSLVKPGTVIPAHAGQLYSNITFFLEFFIFMILDILIFPGPTNSRLRAHLGLIIPKGRYYILIINHLKIFYPKHVIKVIYKPV